MTKLTEEREKDLNEFIKDYPEIKRWVYDQNRCKDRTIRIILRMNDDGVAATLSKTNYSLRFLDYIHEKHCMLALDEPIVFLVLEKKDA